MAVFFFGGWGQTVLGMLCLHVQAITSYVQKGLTKPFLHLQMCAERYMATEDLLKLSGRLQLIRAQVSYIFSTGKKSEIVTLPLISNQMLI